MVELKRRYDWPVRLHEFIDKAKTSAFEWSVHDCVIGWAADAVLAMTDVDLVADFRGTYKDAKSALGILRKNGYSDLADAVADLLPECHPSRAHLGDIAAIADETSLLKSSLGIINGETILVLREDGMGIVPRERATRTFKVGV